VSAAPHSTPPDQQAATDDDLDGPTSEVRPVVPLFAVPWLAVTAAGLRSLPLDARAAYLLSLVDGHCTVETILDICAPELEREEALGLLAHLLQVGAIELRDPLPATPAKGPWLAKRPSARAKRVSSPPMKTRLPAASSTLLAMLAL